MLLKDTLTTVWNLIYNRLCLQGMEGGKFEADFLKKLQDGPVNPISVLLKLVEIMLQNRISRSVLILFTLQIFCFTELSQHLLLPLYSLDKPLPPSSSCLQLCSHHFLSQYWLSLASYCQDRFFVWLVLGFFLLNDFIFSQHALFLLDILGV